jgi:hypothetical protein
MVRKHQPDRIYRLSGLLSPSVGNTLRDVSARPHNGEVALVDTFTSFPGRTG